VRNPGAGGAAHSDWIAREIGVGNRGEYSIFFMPHVDELNPAIATQPVDHGIQSIANDAIAALDSGVRKHLPQKIGYVS
jgi:hypothetical protein